MEHVPLLVLGHEVEGLAAALALAHQGFPVHVLDRGPHPRDPGGSRPGPVALAPAATRQLAVLGLLDQVVGHATMPWQLIHADAASGAVLRRTGLGEDVVARYGHPFLLVRRAALRAVLAGACDADEMIAVEYGRAAATVEDVGDGVLVTCEGGSSYRAEALIGADGPASPARRVLGGGQALSPPYLRYDGPGPAVPAGAEVRLWSAPEIHVVQAPVPGGSEVSVVVPVSPYDELHNGALDRILPRALAGQSEEVRSVVGGVIGGPPSQLHRHHAPLAAGAYRRLTVSGSAACPMLPHTAHATTQALVDAGTLGRAFDRADGRIADALVDYTAGRASAWTRSAEQARDFAALCHADGLVRRIRDRLWSGAPLDEMAAIVGWAASDGWPSSAGFTT